MLNCMTSMVPERANNLKITTQIFKKFTI